MGESNSRTNSRPFRRDPEVRIRAWRETLPPKTQIRPEFARSAAEAVLLKRARSGDTAAFGELAERCRAPLERIARRILRDEADAEDSVQDSLLSAFVNLRSFDGRSTFLTWATRITINCCLMRLRGRRRHHEKCVDSEIVEKVYAGAGSAAPNPEQIVTRDSEESRLHLAIATLPQKLRVAVEIKELQDRTVQETASMLGLSVPAIKARLFRAKGLLKRRLSPKWGSSAIVLPRRRTAG